jgi:hypothetical protein
MGTFEKASDDALTSPFEYLQTGAKSSGIPAREIEIR